MIKRLISSPIIIGRIPRRLTLPGCCETAPTQLRPEYLTTTAHLLYGCHLQAISYHSAAIRIGLPRSRARPGEGLLLLLHQDSRAGVIRLIAASEGYMLSLKSGRYGYRSVP